MGVIPAALPSEGVTVRVTTAPGWSGLLAAKVPPSSSSGRLSTGHRGTADDDDHHGPAQADGAMVVTVLTQKTYLGSNAERRVRPPDWRAIVVSAS